MKKIFDDIRKEIDIHSDEACFMPDDTMVVSENRLKQILDEAEAKWKTNMRKHDIEVRNKAIDEFAEKLKELFKYESAWGETQYYQRLVIDISKIDEIAEQLKGELGIAHRNNRC